MIWMVMRISLYRLLASRVDQVLVLVVPLAFFTIFALIFGRGIGTGTPEIKAVVLDEAGSESSKRCVDLLQHASGLRVLDVWRSADPAERQRLTQLVQSGRISVGIVVHPGLGTATTDSDAELLVDPADAVAPGMAAALVQQALMGARAGTQANPPAESAAAATTAVVPAAHQQPVATSAAMVPPIPAVTTSEVVGMSKSNPVLSMYAAGIAVMFLLFSASSGGAALLEEQESGTLGRLLCSQLSVDELLMGKWAFQTVLGFLQVALMFIWGQLVFGVDLLQHLDGFIAVTLVTAAAASSLGLLLATLCRTRNQLNGLSIVLILAMSALGGSMVPRYLMSDSLRAAGAFTFNAWAVDAYEKVFWRDAAVGALGIELAVLTACAFVMLMLARLLAGRWYTR